MDPFSIGLAAAGLGSQLLGGLVGDKQQALPYLDPGIDFRFGETGVTGKERARQKSYQAEADAVTKRQLGRFDNIHGQTAAEKKRLSDYFAANSSGLPTSGPTSSGMPVSKSAAVNADATTKLARVADYNTQQNEGLSDLRSFADLWGGIDRSLLGDRTDLANISNFRAGSERLIPFELQAAYRPPSYGNQPAPPDNTFADLLRGGGRILTGAGLSGVGGGSAFQGTPQGLFTYGSARPTMLPTGGGWIGGGV